MSQVPKANEAQSGRLLSDLFMKQTLFVFIWTIVTD